MPAIAVPGCRLKPGQTEFIPGSDIAVGTAFAFTAPVVRRYGAPSEFNVMVARALLAVACLVLVVAHFSGNMRQLSDMFDIGIEPQYYLYLVALPFSCVCGWVMLKNGTDS
jgi:hypothetical protein